mgnify:CR=1 FL=1
MMYSDHHVHSLAHQDAVQHLNQHRAAFSLDAPSQVLDVREARGWAAQTLNKRPGTRVRGGVLVSENAPPFRTAETGA